MTNDLYVQLFSPTTADRGHIGTAYPVAENVLLTAAHVIRSRETGKLHCSADKIQARWWKRKDEDPQLCLEVLWDGTDTGFDAMLLSCPFPDEFKNEWSALESRKPAPNEDFYTQGFARVEKRKDAREIKTIQGSTCELTLHTKHFDVNVHTGGPAESAGWKGASGSPVFVGDQIVGVIGSVPDAYAAKVLRCIPIFELLDIPEFRANVYDHDGQIKAGRQQLKTRAIQELEHSATVLAAIAKNAELPAGTSATECVEALSKRRSGKVLDVCIKAKQQLNAQPGNEIVSAFCLCMLPITFRFTCQEMAALRKKMAGMSSAMLSLPVDDEEVIFEVYMAGASAREMRQPRFDGRKWRPDEELMASEPDSGPIRPEGFSHHVQEKIVPGRGRPTSRSKSKVIQRLKNDAEHDRYRHYFIYRPDDYTEDEIRQMSAEFDDLIIFAAWTPQPDDDLANEEFNIVDLLGRILKDKLND